MTTEETQRWSLNRWYGWKNKLNRKGADKKHLLSTPRTVLFCGTEYSNGKVETMETHVLKSGRFIKETKSVKGGTAQLCADKGDQRVDRAKEKFFFDVIVFDLFKRVHVEKRGIPQFWKRGPKEGEPMYEYHFVDSVSERRKLLKNIDELVDSGEVIPWKKMYLQIGTGHFDSLADISVECRNKCECGGPLTPIEYVCSSCGDIIDSLDETSKTFEDFRSLESSVVRCKGCGNADRPLVNKECDDCDDPLPMGLDKLICTMKLQGEGTSSSIVLQRLDPITEYTDIAGRPIIELDDDGEPIEAGGQPVFVEGLDAAVEAHWDYDMMMEIPDHELSEFLGLSKGEVGYAEPPEDNGGGGRRGPKPPRRRF